MTQIMNEWLLDGDRHNNEGKQFASSQDLLQGKEWACRKVAWGLGCYVDNGNISIQKSLLLREKQLESDSDEVLSVYLWKYLNSRIRWKKSSFHDWKNH